MSKKVIVDYSGRTTCLEHKQDDKWKLSKGFGSDCIKTDVTIFDVQWSNCPVEVEEEVRKLWKDNHLGNDNSYYPWDSEEMKEDYPQIAWYLTSRGISKCLINWWW